MRHWPEPWPEVVAAPRSERVRALSDPATRQVLRQVAMSAPPRAMTGQVFANRWLGLEVNDVTDSSLRHLVGRRIVDLAAERGIDPFDAWLDVSVADQCRAGFISYDRDLSRVPANRAALADRRSLWGLFDSGAHLTSMVGGANPTRMIEMLVRDEKLLSLEHAVHRLTGDLAGWWGLVDRGRVAEGCWADLVIFDPDRIARGRMRRLEDWPGGAAHLTSDAIGVHRTFVNGNEVVADSGYTGARPGRTLRSGEDII
jgi:N-acyl-D-aspartate/D-glutamate deacylase